MARKRKEEVQQENAPMWTMKEIAEHEDAYSDVKNMREAIDVANYVVSERMSELLEPVLQRYMILTSAMDTGMFVLFVELGLYTPENDAEREYYENSKKVLTEGQELVAQEATIQRVKAQITLSEVANRVLSGTVTEEDKELHKWARKQVSLSGAVAGREIVEKDRKEFEEMLEKYRSQNPPPMIVPGSDIPQ